MKRDFNQMVLALLNNEHLRDSIYVKDLAGRFLLVNRAKAEHAGLSYFEMQGKTDFDFMTRSEAERAREDDISVMTGGADIVDKIEKITRANGAEVYVSVTKVPWMENGKCVGLIGISRDVTRRVLMEKQILDMLSIATHDIRGPLVSIGALIKLILRGVLGKIDVSVKETLQDIYQRIVNLERIIQTYLSKSSLLNSPIPEKERLDLRQDIIDPILDELSAEIIEQGATIDNRLGSIPGNQIIINAHKTWLRIVYRNLISNALRYGGENCEIAFGVKEFPDHYQFNVFNNGPGVPVAEREKIFEKLHSKGSTGIGLYIVRDLIRKHEGDIWYEQTHSGHPNFVFTLPK